MRGYQLWARSSTRTAASMGQQVQLKIVDDTSSPTQVVTNYQNLITHDKVAFVFGPFSTLLTRARGDGREPLRLRVHRAGRRRAGRLRGEAEQRLLHAAGAGRRQRRRVRALHPLAAEVEAAEDRRLPCARRPVLVADRRPRPLAARGRRDQDGLQDDLPVRDDRHDADRREDVDAKPDLIVGGTQNNDAYAMVKALIQLKYSPKFLFFSNGPNDPAEFP